MSEQTGPARVDVSCQFFVRWKWELRIFVVSVHFIARLGNGDGTERKQQSSVFVPFITVRPVNHDSLRTLFGRSSSLCAVGEVGHCRLLHVACATVTWRCSVGVVNCHRFV